MSQQFSCPSCGLPVAFGSRFCANCGAQLTWPTQQQTQPPPGYQQQQTGWGQQQGTRSSYQQQSGGWGKKIMVGLIVAVIFALVVCLAPLKEIAYTVTADYQDTETYYETEPCEVQVTEPLGYQVVNSYVGEDTITRETSTVIGGIGESHHTWQETIPVACVVVQNTDTVSGVFTVSFSVAKPLDELFLTRTLSLGSNEIKTAECPAYELGDWEHEVTPSTKTVTKTEYKEVEKQRPVTKQRPETRYKNVTLLDYLLHY